ncbi:MAG: hypothetical protein ACKVG7_07690 [Flavobacteriales bacterium]
MKLLSIIFYLISLNFFGTINKTEFYSYFKSNDKKSIAVGIKFISNMPDSNIKNAYLGTLIIKSAQYSKLVSDKLKIFKKGKSLLDNAIKEDPSNIEFRFLRFVLQESCPALLHYKTNLKEDKLLICEKHNTLELTVKNEINSYCIDSALLSIEDLK